MATSEFNPFLDHVTELRTLFAKASRQDNPAIWLYHHKVRTPLFMLEGLTRVHRKAFEEKLFQKWNKRFKKLEDLFGLMDEYLVPLTELKSTLNIDSRVFKYLEQRAGEFTNECNRRLLEKDWLKDKLDSFEAKINSLDIKFDEKYAQVIRFTLERETESILNYANELNYRFSDVDQVHEIRRKLRWLSIYASAFKGLVQLKKPVRQRKSLVRYQTKEVLKSKFIKLDKEPKGFLLILYDQEKFLALSWLINELGKIKDPCILQSHLTEAFYLYTDGPKTEAEKKANRHLNMDENSSDELLKLASKQVYDALVKDKILENLVIG